ncbi:MAG: 30S ribosomal protein S12 methylthiotransferase RimO [Deltaproteobacteria bacterium]|nr:30S ribosomal protein S12 methylthiotransferase RimO [Deltaproteobacteria bacterium]MBW2133207.1 30S ribosomal protein S12 methylthiotransferase RimO [Deltaproteobacteria bacterium]
MRLHLISLGCPKNRVDSEIMLGRLADGGVHITPDPAEADVIVVNTCSFIESAVEESIDTILEAARFKENGRCRRLVVAGCLPQRFREDLARSLPEVDAFLGTGAYEEIFAAVTETRDVPLCRLPDPDLRPAMGVQDHRVRTASHLAYIKIAEGCNRRCTYCIIPRLRGRQKSRPMASIREEAEFLISTGVKELVLVAQETTAYGADLSPDASLEALLDALARLPGDFWIRFLYGHPESVTESLMETVARHPKLVPYFDIPIQHASDRILKKMGRSYSLNSLYRLIEKIRSVAPDAALRTTFLVGFPGETNEDFQLLCRFVQEIRFNHVGVFTYSDAKDVPSFGLKGRVPKSTAKKRQKKLMELQAALSFQKNRGYMNQVHRVLLEKRETQGRFSGRTAFQAPEIDGITRVRGRGLAPGTFADARITEADTYDLAGEAV